MKKKWDEKKGKARSDSKKYQRIKRYQTFMNKLATINRSPSDKKKRNIKSFTVPSRFSIINNPEETVQFLNSIQNYIIDRSHRAHIFLNMIDVTEITVDALLYLLAIIQNIKNNGNIYSFGGNLPINLEARKTVQLSGFLSLVSRSSVKTLITGNEIAIRTGKDANPKLVGDICDFVIKEDIEGNIKSTKFLYTIIGEMMSNANEHAYTNDVAKAQKWLIYVERLNSKIRFMFLDTGFGIINTVKKKWYEKVLSFNHGSIIESAFNGEFRTQTKLENRGKGLPRILRSVRNSDIIKMDVISNKAIYRVTKEENMDVSSEMNCNLDGTLYYWEIVKGEKTI